MILPVSEEGTIEPAYEEDWDAMLGFYEDPDVQEIINGPSNEELIDLTMDDDDNDTVIDLTEDDPDILQVYHIPKNLTDLPSMLQHLPHEEAVETSVFCNSARNLIALSKCDGEFVSPDESDDEEELDYIQQPTRLFRTASVVPRCTCLGGCVCNGGWKPINYH